MKVEEIFGGIKGGGRVCKGNCKRMVSASNLWAASQRGNLCHLIGSHFISKKIILL